MRIRSPWYSGLRNDVIMDSYSFDFAQDRFHGNDKSGGNEIRATSHVTLHKSASRNPESGVDKSGFDFLLML